MAEERADVLVEVGGSISLEEASFKGSPGLPGATRSPSPPRSPGWRGVGVRSPGSREAEVRSNAPEVFSKGPDVTSPGPSVSSSIC